VCQPIKVADATVCTLALDAENVYWVAGDTTSPVLMALPTKGDSPRVVASGSTGVTSIAVDAENLYYARSVGVGPGLNTHSGSVSQVSLHGGAEVTVTSGSYAPSAIAVRGEHVYFTTMWRSTFDPADQTPTGSVIKAPLVTGPATTLVTGLQEAVAIATDATNVYWAEYFGAGCSWGCLVSMPLAGGTPTTIVSNATTTQQNIHAFALMGTEVFWTNEGISSTVMKQDVRGGTPVTLASDQKEPGAIGVDDASVYWATIDGSLMRVSRNGGASTTLASHPCRPCAIAANDASVFWVTCDSLMRLAK
jgi:hypothetical protein